MSTGVPLVAIRHAPTAWNAAKRLQGRTDVPLSAEGIAAAKAWRGDPAWAAYRVLASPLKRARETARLLFPGREIVLDPRLMEMDFGTWEGHSLAELREAPGAAAKERENLGLDFSAPGGETPRQVQARLQPLLNEIAAADVPTVIVTHKAVLRALLSLATGWEFLGKPPAKIKADTAHLFRLDVEGQLSVEKMNVSLLPTGDSSPHPYPLPAGERGFSETEAGNGDKGSGSSAPSPKRGEGRDEGTKRTRYLTSQPRSATHDGARSAAQMNPRVLIHVQHLLGIGHLQRAAAIAGALRERGAKVVVATGGVRVPTMELALEQRGVEVVRLASARSSDSSFSALVDESGNVVDEAWKARRRDAALKLFGETAPDVLMTEMYPFGRRPFRFELNPLLEAARSRAKPPLIACSVRDILVTKEKPGRAEEMAETARRFYDLVLVHSDPALIPFEATFPQAGAIADLIHYTGYVTEAKVETQQDRSQGEIMISAGGGAVGGPLLNAAVAARALSAERDRPWRLIAGGNLPETEFERLKAMAPGFTVERFRADFKTLLARCRVSVSQGGYNTVLEILASRTPSVIVPFAEAGESEQTDRARLLAAKGLLRLLPATELDPRRLAAEIDRAAVMAIPPFTINLDGGRRSAALILEALAKRAA